ADPQPAQLMLRHLHTLKGSARMAGAMALGQHLHEMESQIQRLTGGESPSYADIDELLAHMDAGLQMFEHLQHPPAPGATSTGDAPSEEFASLADAPAGTAVQQPLMAAPGKPMPSSQALQDVAADNAPVPAQPI